MRPTILLVEDNAVTRRTVRATLEAEDLHVLTAADGRTARAVFGEHRVALVLQDLVLPDTDGFALVRELRALPGGREIPFLAFSGLSSKREIARLSAAGFDDVISKPVDPARLRQMVGTYLPSDLPTVSSPELESVRIIVADDDAVQRKLVRFRLQRAGFSVRTAADGLEVLALARAERPDAIVSDVLMPRLDGFGLCMRLREEPELARVPVLLITNSYVEDADRALARKTGASDLVLRTPELSDVIERLRRGLAAPSSPEEAPVTGELESERVGRLMSQLERQMALNVTMTQRCAVLSAELAVLKGIGDALATDDDIDATLRSTLAACFDAGGISLGALYLREPGGVRRVLGVGTSAEWSDEDLETFFGAPELLERVVEARTTLVLASRTPDPLAQALLTRAGAGSAIVVPLVREPDCLGVLLMMSTANDLAGPDRLPFAQAVGAQIAQSLAMARAFALREASERRAMEQAALLASILDSIGDGVVAADERGVPTRWNREAEDVIAALELEAEARPSERPTTFAKNGTTPLGVRTPLARAIRGEPVDAMELLMRTPEGRDRWYSVNARPLRDGRGGASGGVAVFRDVTEQKAAQTRLIAADRMASLGLLAAGLAHEINNPMAAVGACLELAAQILKSSPASEDRAALGELLDDALLGAARVTTIVRDLKVFSRHEEQPIDAVDLRPVLESTLRLAENTTRHRARVVMEYEDCGLVQGSESRLGQVFLNLVVNAAQAITPGNVSRHTIRVSARPDPAGGAAVEVSDTGPGIPPESIPHLFTPFYTTKSKHEGTGLGLAICERIVSELGGRITVASEPGRGTTFTVHLRGAPHPRPSASAAPPSDLPAVARRGRVLVVDDEPMIGRIAARALGDRHDVECYTEGRAALDAIAAGARFDVILCDLMMPQMTGMDFHDALALEHPELARRIVFLTGGAFTPEARAFLDEVANVYLEKPFPVARLRALVAGWVDPLEPKDPDG